MAQNAETTMQDNPFRRFWDLGYKRLVPVIPPGAEIAEKSSLAARIRAGDDARGKAPGVRGNDGKWRGINFPAIEAEEADLDAWAPMGASVGVKLGQGLIALDIDTTHKQTAQMLYALAAETLGPAVVRFGQSPKCLMLYEAPPDTTYRQVVFQTPTEAKARVEVLSEGRQFVADGVHPKTGQAYRWPHGTPPRNALTTISNEQLDAFLRTAAERLQGQVSTAGERLDAPDQPSLRAPSWEALERAVKAVRNTSALFPEREDYVRMAYAIKGATPEGYEHDALDLFLDWCDRWEEGTNDLAVAMEDWGRAKPPYRTGYSWITQHAPTLFFEPHTGPLSDLAQDMFPEEDNAAGNVFEILRIGDIFALPDPTFAIDRHVPEASMGFLYGRPGCGKSFIALDWALHIAYGLPTWHGDAISVRPGANVLYLAREGSTGFKARIRAWQQKHLTPANAQPTFALIRQTINFMQPEDIGKIVRTARAALSGPVDLIVVDTVSRVLPGADENLQKEMTLFVKACDALQDAFKAIVLGVHHSGKSGDMRGSSVLKGAGDFVFKLERKEGARIGSLICEKQKDAPDGWSERYAFPAVEFEGGSSLVVERVESAEAGSDTCSPDRRADILRAMSAAWDAGEPWSAAPQARERYAVRRMSSDFGVSSDVAEQWLAIWVDEGRISVDTANAHARIKGYRVLLGEDDTSVFD